MKAAAVANRGLQIGLGQLGSQLSLLIRHTVIARWIAPAEFGIATLFLSGLQFIELVSNTASETLLVQAKDGDDEALQSAIHWWRATRGFVNCLLVAILAGPIVYLFELPGMEWEIRAVGLVTIIRGFFHTDANRLQRHLRYGPWIASDTGSNIAATIAAIAVAAMVGDHRAIIAALFTQAIVSVGLSQLLAERPYRWRKDRAAIRRMLDFGWPLMANGILMFGILQGDRLILGSAPRVFGNKEVTLAEVGLYSIVSSLAMAPFLAISSVCTSLFLPMLSRVQSAREQFLPVYRACLRWTSWIAAAGALFFVLTASWLVSWLSGPKYRPGWWLVVWLSLLWSVRLVRTAPTLAALSLGDTKNALYANIARGLSLVAICVAVAAHLGIEWLGFIGLAGETVALAVSVVRLRVRQQVGALEFAKVFATYGAVVVAAILLSPYLAWSIPLQLVVITAFAATAMFLPGARSGLAEYWTSFRNMVSRREGVL